MSNVTSTIFRFISFIYLFIYLFIYFLFISAQATIFEQDFKQERQDREKAHSKHIETEDQYKHQLGSLMTQFQAVSDDLHQQKKACKDMEATYQARLSKQSYSTGEMDRRLQLSEQRIADLEVGVAYMNNWMVALYKLYSSMVMLRVFQSTTERIL